MRAVAADVMLVFGDVGEMREIAEGAHDRERLVGVEAVEDRLELAPRAGLVVAVEADRGLADALDERVGLLALLLAHGVAEDAAEQADVVAQRHVLVVVFRRHAGGLAARSRRPWGASVGEEMMLHCGRQRRKPSKSRAKTTVLVLRSREAASKDDPDRFAGRVRAPVRLDWSVLRGSCFARAAQEEGHP